MRPTFDMSSLKIDRKPAIYAHTKKGVVGLFVGGMKGNAGDRMHFIPELVIAFLRR